MWKLTFQALALRRSEWIRSASKSLYGGQFTLSNPVDKTKLHRNQAGLPKIGADVGWGGGDGGHAGGAQALPEMTCGFLIYM